jgi:hypothetical protein
MGNTTVQHYNKQIAFYYLCSSGGCDRMVVGFTIAYAISAYHHWCCEFESRSGWGVQYYVMKFVSDVRQTNLSSMKMDNIKGYDM